MESKKGFIPSEIQLGDFQHGDGKLGTLPLQPDGNWTAYLPEPRTQQDGEPGQLFDPFVCVTQATIACVEILEKKEYGTSTDWARRFLAAISGTGEKRGNDPNTVSQALKNAGCVYETEYPFHVKDYATFYQPIPQSIKTLAIAEFAEYAYGHSWVSANPDSMMAALTYSPLSAAGYAWQKDPQTGYYITPPGSTPEHDFCVYGYVQGQYWLILDSYADESGSFIKKLAWDYQFTQAKRHTLNRQIMPVAASGGLWQSFLDLIHRILGIGDYAGYRILGGVRSPKWPEVRRMFLKNNPVCAVCGGKKRLTVHHIHPVHLFPQYELCATLPDGSPNYITLCEGNPTINCHLYFGHWDNFRTKWNPNVVEDAAAWRPRITAKDENSLI